MSEPTLVIRKRPLGERVDIVANQLEKLAGGSDSDATVLVAAIVALRVIAMELADVANL